MSNLMTCTKKGCTARRFRDSDRCFNHQGLPGLPGGAFFKAWFIFCALVALVMIGAFLWGGFEIVTWVTSQ